jgi:hypothetical protein
MARGAVEDNNLALRDLLVSNLYQIKSANGAVGSSASAAHRDRTGVGGAPIPASLARAKR